MLNNDLKTKLKRLNMAFGDIEISKDDRHILIKNGKVCGSVTDGFYR